MPTLSIPPFAIDDEQNDAIAGKVAEINTANAAKTPPVAAITVEQFLQNALISATNSWVREAYEKAVKRLGEGAALLPYADRLDLISEVDTKVKVQLQQQ